MDTERISHKAGAAMGDLREYNTFGAISAATQTVLEPPNPFPRFSHTPRANGSYRNFGFPEPVLPPHDNPISAIQAISRLRGGTQSHLMLGDDGNLWVVKFKNNPQHVRILANELIANRIAGKLGLSVPMTAVVNVSDWLIERSPQLSIDLSPRSKERCSDGLQFGSRFVGGLMPGQVIDRISDDQLVRVRNLMQFAGMLAFDKWTGNSDGRQAVYQRKPKQHRYTAFFIDQGFCFGGGTWSIRNAPLQGVFARNAAYSEVIGWDSFEPWLTRIEQFCPDVLREIAGSVPPEWYDGDRFRLAKIIDTLLERRSRVRENLEQFRKSDRVPFPRWKVNKSTYGRTLGSALRPLDTRNKPTVRQLPGSVSSTMTPMTIPFFDSKLTSTPWMHSSVVMALPQLLPNIDRWLTSHSF